MSDEAEVAWLREQQMRITEYFQREGIVPPRNWIVEFSLPPKLALWSEPSPDGSRQIWAISGDCPTDYLVFDQILSARDAMAQFAIHWMDVSSHMKQGRQHPRTRIGDPNNPRQLQELGGLLETRAQLLHAWAQQDEMW